MARGETRKLSFGSSSLAIISCPQSGFSSAMRRINRRSSGGIGRPVLTCSARTSASQPGLSGFRSSAMTEKFKRARVMSSLYLYFFVGLCRNGGAACPSRSADLPLVALVLSAAPLCGGQTVLCNGIRTGVEKGSPATVAAAFRRWRTPCPRAPALSDRRAPWLAQISACPTVRLAS
jgi:hypothetical protein